MEKTAKTPFLHKQWIGKEASPGRQLRPSKSTCCLLYTEVFFGLWPATMSRQRDYFYNICDVTKDTKPIANLHFLSRDLLSTRKSAVVFTKSKNVENYCLAENHSKLTEKTQIPMVG